jgi:NADPH2:quinone reductase
VRGWFGTRLVRRTQQSGSLSEGSMVRKQGLAHDVLVVGEMPDPTPAAGEVRIRVAASGVNPGDVKKRQDAFATGMAFPRIIPHSDSVARVDHTAFRHRSGP